MADKDKEKENTELKVTPEVEEAKAPPKKPRLKPIIEYRDCKKIVVGYIDIDTGKKSVVKASKKK